MNKIAKKVISFAASLAIAMSTAVSALPTIQVSAANETPNAWNMDITSYNILSTFGTLSGSDRYSNNTMNPNNNSKSLMSENMYSKYSQNIKNGYTFTMSRNFNAKYQAITVGSKTCTPSKSLPVQKVTSVGADTVWDLDAYSNTNGSVYYGGSTNYVNGSINSASYNRTYKSSYVGTLASNLSDSDSQHYIIRLKDKSVNSKSIASPGNISCTYNNVGTYIDSETGESKNVDVVLTVTDYQVHDDYINMDDLKSHNLSNGYCLTEAQYNKLSAEYKNYYRPLSYAQKKQCNLSGTYYGLTVYNYSIANAKGLINDSWSSSYGGAMRFTTNRVGIDVDWVDWVKMNYTFYKAGTNTPISVKGQSVFKDVDWGQGVSFPTSSIGSTKTIRTIGSWSNFNDSKFMYPSFNYNDGSKDVSYSGVIDYPYRDNANMENITDMAAISFAGTGFDTIYSFTSGMPSFNSGSTWFNRVHLLSDGTIQSDLPSTNSSDGTGTLTIDKKITVNNGAEMTAADAVEEKYLHTAYTNVIERVVDMYFYVQNDSGKYLTATLDNTTGNYNYSGTTNNIDDATKFYLMYTNGTTHYVANILGLNIRDSYKVIEDGVAETSKMSQPSEATNRINNDNGVTNINSTGAETKYCYFNTESTINGSNITTNATASIKAIFVNNFVETYGLRIYKFLTTDSKQAIITDATEAGYMSFSIKNSKGKYVVLSNSTVDGEAGYTYASTMQYEAKFPLLKNSAGYYNILVSNLPKDTYTISEYSSSDTIIAKYSKTSISKKAYNPDNTIGWTSITDSYRTNSISVGLNSTSVGTDGFVNLYVNNERKTKTVPSINLTKTITKDGITFNASANATSKTNKYLRFYFTDLDGKVMVWNTSNTSNKAGNYTANANRYNMSTIINNSAYCPYFKLDENGNINIDFASKPSSALLFTVHEIVVDSDGLNERASTGINDISDETLMAEEVEGYANSTLTKGLVNANTGMMYFAIPPAVTSVAFIAENPGPTHLELNKYVVKPDGTRELATAENDNQLNTTAKFYLVDENNKFITVKQNDNYSNCVGGNYEYTGTSSTKTNCYMYLGNMDVDDNYVNGKIFVNGLPKGTYKIYEEFDEGGFVPSSDKYHTQVYTVALGDANTIEYDASCNKSVDIDNIVEERDIDIIKLVTRDGVANTVESSAYDMKNIAPNLYFYLTTENGKYVVFDENMKASGLSDTLTNSCYLYIYDTGHCIAYGLADETYTVHESIVENPTVDISKWVTTDKTVTIRPTGKNYYDAETGKAVSNINKANVVNDLEVGNLKIQKTTLTEKDIDGIGFTLSGLSDSNDNVNLYGKTDADGNLIFKDVLVGTYLLTEDKTTVPHGYLVHDPITVVITKEDTLEKVNASEGTIVNNIYTKISLKKVNKDKPEITIANAEFTVYTDVNENGTYEAGIDTVYSYNVNKDEDQKIMIDHNDGNYSMSGMPLGKYIVKETQAPDGYRLDSKYYPVTIDSTNPTAIVANNGHNFEEEQYFGAVTITKRIPVAEVNNDIYYEHGNPTFIIKFSDEKSHTRYKSFEFTKEYVDSHKFLENGKYYVEQSVTYSGLDRGTYTASEVNCLRYELDSVINMDRATFDDTTETVTFNVAPLEECKATFYNVKTDYSNLSHNSIVVNHIEQTTNDVEMTSLAKTSGNGTVITLPNNKVMLSDTLSSDSTALIDYLEENHISHIDYISLSSWIDENYGGIQQLINGKYIDADTTIYLPSKTLLTDADVQSYLTSINNTLSTTNNTDLTAAKKIVTALATAKVNMVYPTENQKSTIGDMELTFVNTDIQYVYDSWKTKIASATSFGIEDSSMGMYLTYAGNTTFFAGSLNSENTAKMLERAEVIPAHVIIAANHGINNLTDEFYDKSDIKFAVVCGLDYSNPDNKITSNLKDYVNAIYSACPTNVNIKMNENGTYNINGAYVKSTLYSIVLNASKITGGITGVYQLSNINARNIDTAKVIWKSSDTSVATVSSSGLVTMIGTGTATITATYNGTSTDNTFAGQTWTSDTCAVVVQ